MFLCKAVYDKATQQKLIQCVQNSDSIDSNDQT